MVVRRQDCPDHTQNQIAITVALSDRLCIRKKKLNKKIRQRVLGLFMICSETLQSRGKVPVTGEIIWAQSPVDLSPPSTTDVPSASEPNFSRHGYRGTCPAGKENCMYLCTFYRLPRSMLPNLFIHSSNITHLQLLSLGCTFIAKRVRTVQASGPWVR